MGLGKWSTESTDAGARALLDEAKLLGLRSRACWSIAELRLSEDDYQRTLAWLEALPPAKARELRFSTALGLMLLAVAAETARRHAGAGEVWPVFADLQMSPSTRAVLLDANGTPTSVVRQTIGKAARRCGLRTALDAGQPWYATVVLQYGFSQPALESMLARWVRQGVPDSVAPLLEGPQRSQEFAETWGALRSLGDPTALDDTRLVLERSPWILDAWIEPLVELRSTIDPPGSSSARREPPTELASPILRARVTWPAAKPQLDLDLCPSLVDPRLADDRHRLLVDGVPSAVYLKREGTHRPSKSRLENVVPAPSLHVVLVDRGGEVALTQDVEVWPEDELACAYSPSGRALGQRGPVGGGAGGVLVHVPGATAHPEPPPGTQHKFGERRALKLGHGPVRLEWPDGSTWEEGPRRAQRGSVLRGEPTDPSVAIGARATIRSPAPLLAISEEGWALTDPHTVQGLVDPAMTSRFAAPVRRRDGSLARLECQLPLTGAAIHRGGRWETLGARIEARDIASLAWRLFSPTPLRGTAILVAGSHIVDRISVLGRATHLSGQALGLGESLGWVDSTKLYDADATPTLLCPEVVDHGELRACTIEGDLASLELRAPHEPEGMYVIVWTADGLRSFGAEAIVGDESTWLIEVGSDPVALVVGFGTARLGAWWSAEWADALADVAAHDACGIAWFVRAARLPILEVRSREAVRAFARRHPVECARTWWVDPGELDAPELDERSIPDRLSRLARGAGAADRWKAAQRELYADGAPAFEPESSEDVLDVIGQRDGSTYIQAGLCRVAELGAPWCTPYLEGQRAFLERQRRKHGRDWLEVARLELTEDDLERPSSQRAATRSLARALGIRDARCRELVEENTRPISLAKRLALAHRDFAFLSTLHALRAGTPIE